MHFLSKAPVSVSFTRLRDFEPVPGRLGVVASVQPAFLTSEVDWLESRIGPERLLRTYPFASLERNGAILAGGSDCPVEPPNPLHGIAAARDRAGIVPGEGLRADRALAMFTTGAAESLAEPDPLAPGSPADLAVLDVDPGMVTPDELRAASIIETYVNGARVDVDRTIPTWT